MKALGVGGIVIFVAGFSAGFVSRALAGSTETKNAASEACKADLAVCKDSLDDCRRKSESWPKCLPHPS
jgi:hypothetical protein